MSFQEGAQQPTPRHKKAVYDIDVEQRDLEYYSVSGLEEEVLHG
jgi:hypothetical protein